jgi:hypothetical protein
MYLYQINKVWFGLYRQNKGKNLPTFGFSRDITKVINFLTVGKYGDEARDKAIAQELLTHNLPIYGQA